MHKIRKSVFETNSSSSHSLTMSATDLGAMPFAKDVLRAGAMTVSKGEYGWEWQRYYGAAAKMDYLFTQLFNDDIPMGDPHSVTRELRDDDMRFDQLCRVVKDHTGVDILVAPGSTGYIDHQSVGTGLEVFESDDKLAAFLFSMDNYIETGNDNSGPPFQIHTDRGMMDYYQDFYWEPPATHVEVKLTLKRDWRPQFFTEKGALLDDEHNTDALKTLQSKGTVTAVHWDCQGRWYRFEHEDARGATASMFADRDNGMRFLKDLAVTTTFKKTDEFRDDTAVVTVKVPQEVADLLKGLKKTRLPAKKEGA